MSKWQEELAKAAAEKETADQEWFRKNFGYEMAGAAQRLLDAPVYRTLLRTDRRDRAERLLWLLRGQGISAELRGTGYEGRFKINYYRDEATMRRYQRRRRIGLRLVVAAVLAGSTFLGREYIHVPPVVFERAAAVVKALRGE